MTASQHARGDTLWEVDLAVPPLLLHVEPEQPRIDAISMQAELSEVTQTVLQAGVLDEAAAVARGAARTGTFNRALPLGDDQWALANDSDPGRIVLYRPQAATAEARLTLRPLRVAGDATVTAPPVFYQQGLLVPLDNGQVALVHPTSGEPVTLPFQAPIASDAKTHWLQPAVMGEYFVIADQDGQVYRVGVEETPEPHLEAIAQTDRQGPIAGALAAAGDTVYAIVREDTADTILSLAAEDLAAGERWPLDGRVVWGPYAVGDAVLLATDGGQLMCLAAGQQLRWTRDLPDGLPISRPLEQDGHLIMAAAGGTVWRVAAEDGREIARRKVGEPLAAGPVLFPTPTRQLLLLAGTDGTLHLIPALPDNES